MAINRCLVSMNHLPTKRYLGGSDPLDGTRHRSNPTDVAHFWVIAHSRSGRPNSSLLPMGSNLSGIAGAALGGAVGYGMGKVLDSAGFASIDSVACGALAGFFSASMFGLLYDRSTVPEFRRSYRVLT